MPRSACADLRTLDIEAIAARGGALYLGLKAPLDGDGRAQIWRVGAPDRLLAGDLVGAQLTRWSTLGLLSRPTAERPRRHRRHDVPRRRHADRQPRLPRGSIRAPDRVVAIAELAAGQMQPRIVRRLPGRKAEGSRARREETRSPSCSIAAPKPRLDTATDASSGEACQLAAPCRHRRRRDALVLPSVAARAPLAGMVRRGRRRAPRPPAARAPRRWCARCRRCDRLRAPHAPAVGPAATRPGRRGRHRRRGPADQPRAPPRPQPPKRSLIGDNERFLIAFRLCPTALGAHAKIAAARASYRAERATHRRGERESSRRSGALRRPSRSATPPARPRHQLGCSRAPARARRAAPHGAATQIEVTLADQDQSRSTPAAPIERRRRKRAELAGCSACRPTGVHPVWDTAAARAMHRVRSRALGAARSPRPELAELAARAEAADAAPTRARPPGAVVRGGPGRALGPIRRDWAVASTSRCRSPLNSGAIAAADARRAGLVAERRRLAAAPSQVDAAIELAEATGRRARGCRSARAAGRALTALVAPAGRRDQRSGQAAAARGARRPRRRAVLDADHDHRWP